MKCDRRASPTPAGVGLAR